MIRPKSQVHREAVSAHYDTLDELYRKIWGVHLHHGLWLNGRKPHNKAVTDLLDYVGRELELCPGQTICDVGCGYGASAAYLASRFGARVTGITLSRRQFEFARVAHAGRAELRFLLGDWMDNSFADSSFDHLVAIESSEHMSDKPSFFAESHRVLKPTGTVAVCAWLSASDPGQWQITHLLEPICSEGRLPSLASEDEYRLMLSQAGFTNIRFKDLTNGVKRTWTICIRRTVAHFTKTPKDAKNILFRHNPDARFFKTLFRMRAAYATGALRYGLFVATKPRNGRMRAVTSHGKFI